MQKPELKSENEQELRKSAEEYAQEKGLKLNPNKDIVDNIIKGLLAKKQKFGKIYCPCRANTGNKEKDAEIVCPCVFHRGEIELQGHCICNLFFKSQ
jgi:ferredoxin-thioredoxin reductase catalytic subunit